MQFSKDTSTLIICSLSSKNTVFTKSVLMDSFIFSPPSAVALLISAGCHLRLPGNSGRQRRQALRFLLPGLTSACYFVLISCRSASRTLPHAFLNSSSKLNGSVDRARCFLGVGFWCSYSDSALSAISGRIRKFLPRKQGIIPCLQYCFTRS